MIEDFRLQVAESLLRYESAKNDELQSKNAKLRELLKDMWASMADCHDTCATCKHFEDEYEAADGSFGHTGECVFLRRMQELGVEVD